MKRDRRFPRCGRFIDLVELVRKRSRYQPYGLRAAIDTAYGSDSSMRPICGPAWNSRFNNLDLLSHMRRSSILNRRRPQPLAASSSDRIDRATSVHLSRTSVHTYSDAFSQTPSCVLNVESDTLVHLTPSASGGEEVKEASSASSIHVGDNAVREEVNPRVPVMPRPLAPPLMNQQQLQMSPNFVFTGCSPQEAERLAAVERAVRENIAAAENAQAYAVQTQEEAASSRESIQSPPDEEAGGDGHHNDSVLEIEITLRSVSGNDGDDEEEEDDENEQERRQEAANNAEEEESE